MRLSVGIDEAGRGCVIGPLAVACVAADESDRRWFWKNNVRLFDEIRTFFERN